MFRIFFVAILCCSLFAEIQFSCGVIYQDNEAIFSATIINNGSVDRNMEVFVNDEKVDYHPILGYISGLPQVKPNDMVEIIVKDASKNTVYKDSIVLPAKPEFYSLALDIDQLYTSVYQWNATSAHMLFCYESDKDVLFEKHFTNYESSVEIPQSRLNAGNGYVSIAAINGHNKSLFATVITRHQINVAGDVRVENTSRGQLTPVKSWKAAFKIPKVGTRTFDMNAYMAPKDGQFKISGRNRRWKASVVSIIYNEQPVWSWNRVYKFSKKNYSQSFPMKAQETIVVAAHHIRWGIDFQ